MTDVAFYSGIMQCWGGTSWLGAGLVDVVILLMRLPEAIDAGR